MPNMSLKKVNMPVADPKVRSRNFNEVETGYTLEMAKEEAARCLQCKNKPCMNGCPVAIDIPAFLKEIEHGNITEAYEIVSRTTSLPAVCGRVCPQETQCEQLCVRGVKGEPVAIGRLERFVADYVRENAETTLQAVKCNNVKIAVVGSGPAGLSCAYSLVKLGYSVTIFESFHIAGGVLMYGIPEFRLPKYIVEYEINKLKSLGVEIKTNMVIGKILTLDDLREMGYKSIFIGSGAGLPNFMGIKGEHLSGVFSANEFLTRINLMQAYKKEAATPILRAKKVAVIGGGNVTMDAARSALRLGAEKVYVVYRRGEAEMPARIDEIHHAKEEGIEFVLLSQIKAINGNEEGKVVSITCVKMQLAEPDESGRCRPYEVEGSEHDIEVNSVIMAIGSSPNPLLASTENDLTTNKRGCLYVDEEMHTSVEDVWAGGDAVSGAATVILAMGAGLTAAQSIDKYLGNIKN